MRMPLLQRTLLRVAALTAVFALTPACSNAQIAQTTARRQTTSTVVDSWSQFRGPNGLGATTLQVPIDWSETEHIRWRTPLPGAGASSPVVLGDRVYVTSYSGFFVPGESGGSQADLKRHLLAINRNDGKVTWEKSVPAKLPEEESIRDHGFAASTPAVDEQYIYAFFGKTGVLAYTHDGELAWQADVGSKTNGWGSAASPVLCNDLLIVNASVESDSLVALSKSTGKEVWRKTGITESWNTPLVINAKDGSKQIIVAKQGELQAYDSANGKQLWTCKTDITWYMVPSLITDGEVVYCLGGRSGVAGLAVRLGGSGDVTTSHRLWISEKGSNVSSPVTKDGYLYWMNDQRGIAYCAEAKTGEIVYEQRLDRADQVYASSLLAGDRVYHFARDGRTFVLAAKPEFEQVAINDLRDGSQFNGSPAVDGKRLLLRSDKFLYCIE